MDKIYLFISIPNGWHKFTYDHVPYGYDPNRFDSYLRSWHIRGILLLFQNHSGHGLSLVLCSHFHSSLGMSWKTVSQYKEFRLISYWLPSLRGSLSMTLMCAICNVPSDLDSITYNPPKADHALTSLRTLSLMLTVKKKVVPHNIIMLYRSYLFNYWRKTTVMTLSLMLAVKNSTK